MRALHRDGRDRVGCVLERDIVGDNEAVQVLVQRLARLGLHIQQKIIRAAQNIRVRQDAAFIIQEKRIAAGAWRKLLDVIGGHRVQQTRAIFAGKFDFAARGKVQPGGAISKSFVAGHFFGGLHLSDRYLR